MNGAFSDAAARYRYVLFVVNEEAHVRELLRVADALLQTTDLRPVVFMEDRLSALGKPKVFTDRNIEVLMAGGVAAVESFPLPAGPKTIRRFVADLLANPQIAKFIRPPLRNWMGWLGPDETVLVRILRDVMLKRAAQCNTLLGQRSWAAIVMCEDNIELDTGVWTAVAHRHDVQSVIVPYTISNTAEFAEAYVDFAPYQVQTTPQNRTIARLFPAWAMDYKGRRFLRTNCPKIVAIEQLGLTPPNPWLLNSGDADAIAVESAAMHDYYRAAGIPAAQLVMTGSFTDDVLASVLAEAVERRQRVLSGFGKKDDRPLLLCGLPPDQRTFGRPGSEFRDYDDLLEFWGDCLSELKAWNIVIRPHPKTPPDRLDALRQKGLAITYDDTATLVPLCDLYVTAVSATIRWAVACAKPVLNYDVYQFGYEDYRGLDGVWLVTRRIEFKRALDDLTSGAGKLEELAEMQRRDARRWAMLDGASTRRLVALLRGEVDQPAAVAVGMVRDR